MNKIWKFITNHKMETGALIVIICVAIFFTFTVHSCVKDIKEAGGLRAVIVEAGKEAKLIAEDITDDINKAYEKEKNNPYK